MDTPANPYLSPAIAVFAVLAITFAGFGGLAVMEDHRILFAAGSCFWLVMLFVPIMFLSSSDPSWTRESRVAAAHGALAGTCFSLCLAPGEGWASLLAYATGGGLFGFIGYWAWLLRYGALWRDH